MNKAVLLSLMTPWLVSWPLTSGAAAPKSLPIIVEVRAEGSGELVPAHIRIVHQQDDNWYDGATLDGRHAPDRRACSVDSGLYLEAVPSVPGYGKGFRTCYDPQPLVIYVREHVREE